MSSEVPLKTVLRKMNAHRNACRESADANVQNTWDAIEDYLSRLIAAGVEVERNATP